MDQDANKLDHLVVIDLLKHCYGLIYFRDTFKDLLQKVDQLMNDQDLQINLEAVKSNEQVMQTDEINKGLDNYKTHLAEIDEI